MDWLNLTPKEKLAIRQEFLDAIHAEYSLEEVMAKYKTEEILSTLKPEEIEAYLKKIKRKEG